MRHLTVGDAVPYPLTLSMAREAVAYEWDHICAAVQAPSSGLSAILAERDVPVLGHEDVVHPQLRLTMAGDANLPDWSGDFDLLDGLYLIVRRTPSDKIKRWYHVFSWRGQDRAVPLDDVADCTQAEARELIAINVLHIWAAEHPCWPELAAILSEDDGNASYNLLHEHSFDFYVDIESARN